MLREMLEFLAGQAQAGARPVPVEIKNPREVRLIVGNGDVHKFPVPPPPRAHTVKCLDEIIALATRFKDEENLNSDIGTKDMPVTYYPVVWYDESSVVLVIDDDGHRCETATLTLVESDAFRVVKSLAKGCQSPKFDHKSFMRLLRIDLAGTLPPAVLLDIVRRVKFENGSVATSEVKRSRESLGREITSAVSAEAEIPDAITLSVPVYKTMGETEPLPIRCTVEVDPMEGRFSLIPFSDEIERVQQLAVASIADRLREGLTDGVSCYHGRP